MNIQTERLWIIPCSIENYAEFFDRYEMGPHIEMHIDQLKNNPSISGWGVWFVVDKETNEVIGDIGFKGKPDQNKTVETGYGILPSAQNKGFATEAVKGLIQWAFSTGEVEKVIAECLEDNFASIKVLEKLGMNRTFAKNGMIYWEITKD